MDITLTFGVLYKFKKSFKTNTAVIKWAKAEQLEWAKLAAANTALILPVSRVLDFLINNFNNAPDIREATADTLLSQWLNLNQNRQNGYIPQNIILSTDMPEFHFLKQCAVNYPDTVPEIFNYFKTKQTPQQNTKESLMAARLIGNFLLPNEKASLAPNRAAFNTLARRFSDRIKELEIKLAEAEQKTADWIHAEEDKSADVLNLAAETAETRIKTQIGLQAESTFALQSKMKTLMGQIETDTQAAIDRIDETDKRFNTDLSLKPAYKYWSRKSANHRKKATGILLGIVAAGVLTVVVLGTILHRLLNMDSTLGQFGETRTFLILTVSVALTTILFWAARIATRLYLGNVHLVNDATERATLIHTYLALNVRDKATDADRALVLSTVFRPSTDGVVKDDAAPGLSPAGLLAGRGTK